MHIYTPGKTFHEECSGYNAAKIFPYLADRLDAIKELKEMYRDTYRITNFGRQMAGKDGALKRRIGSVPMHIIMEAIQMYGHDFLASPTKIHAFLRANPEWSFIYGT